MKTKTVSSPLISVIVPVYNTPLTIARCLDSIFQQTYRRIEVIIIDDGSTDISGEIAERLASQDKRAKFISQKNQGVSVARNNAMKHVRGEYVTYVDADDEIDHKMIERMYCQIEKTGAKIAMSSLAEISPTGHEYARANRSKNELLSIEKALVMLLRDKENTLGVGGKLYAKELFEKVKWPKGKRYEDVGTTYKLFQQCDKIAYIPKPFYRYYQTPNSRSRSQLTRHNLDIIEMTDRMARDLSRRFADESVQNAIKLRRMHARFSILRLTAEVRASSLPKISEDVNGFSREELINLKKEMTQYIRENKEDILKNPLAEKRDRLALFTLRLGFPFFKVAWRLYLAMRPY